MHPSLLLLLGLTLQIQPSLGITLPNLKPEPSPSPLSKRFIPEPRASHLDWNAPRTSNFLAQRTNLHSVESFTNPPLLSRNHHAQDRDLHNFNALEDLITSRDPSHLPTRATPGRWESLAGSMASHPAPVSWGGSRMDLYYMGKDKTCQHKYRDSYNNNKWGDWENLGGDLDSAPSTCSRKKDNMHVFCKGGDGQAWHRSYSGTNKGTWGSWQAMGGNMKGYPSSYSWGDDHVGVYVSSKDGECWTRRYDENLKGGWYGWENLGGYMAGPPKAVTWGREHTGVFCRGVDGQAWWRQYGGKGGNSKWGDWEPLGGSLDSEPAACAWDGRMDMFVKGSDGGCWWKSYKDWGGKGGGTPTANQSSTTSKGPAPPASTSAVGTPPTTLPKWGMWENLGGDMKDGVVPEVVEVGGNMEVYITGKDDGLYRKTWDSKTDTWSEGWEAMGGKMDSKPNAVVWNNGQVDVYGKGTDGTLKRCYT